jgi:hypothetical protein
MLDAALEYVTDNIKRLPNFLATRTTRSLDDSPQVAIDFGTQPLRGGLHYVNTSDQEISFRNGHEELVNGNLTHGSEQSHSAPPGLTSWGEFGTLQAIILIDSARGNLKWSHWERGTPGVQAPIPYPEGRFSCPSMSDSPVKCSLRSHGLFWPRTSRPARCQEALRITR